MLFSLCFFFSKETNVYHSVLEIWPLFFCWYVQVAEFILSCCNPWLNSQVQKMLMLEPLGHSAPIFEGSPRSILTSIPMSLFHCLQKMIYWLFLCSVSNYLLIITLKTSQLCLLGFYIQKCLLRSMKTFLVCLWSLWLLLGIWCCRHIV